MATDRMAFQLDDVRSMAEDVNDDVRSMAKDVKDVNDAGSSTEALGTWDGPSASSRAGERLRERFIELAAIHLATDFIFDDLAAGGHCVVDTPIEAREEASEMTSATASPTPDPESSWPTSASSATLTAITSRRS